MTGKSVLIVSAVFACVVAVLSGFLIKTKYDLKIYKANIETLKAENALLEQSVRTSELTIARQNEAVKAMEAKWAKDKAEYLRKKETIGEKYEQALKEAEKLREASCSERLNAVNENQKKFLEGS